MFGRNTQLCDYITRVVDARLSFLYSDQSSISNSYTFLEEENGEGLLFILRYPSGMQLDSKTYFQLYDIISPAISSVKTMIRPITFQLVPIDGEPVEMSQGFFFPWRNGRARRLIGNIDDILTDYNLQKEIPIMKGMTVSRKVSSYLITGNTGSGKTEAFKYLAQFFQILQIKAGLKKQRLLSLILKRARAQDGQKRITLILN